MELIKYPSIGQYRNVVKAISLHVTYKGKDGNDNPIYDNLLPKPIVKFIGTVKLHGTNASICYNDIDGLWIQSKKRILTPEDDNAGFAFFAESKKKFFLKIIDMIVNDYIINIKLNTISIYGEWCGKGIEKKVGISQLSKRFIIFGVKITPNNENDAYWLDIKDQAYCFPKNNIYTIYQFPTFEIDIDFNRPEEFQNKLNEYTAKVEEKCPVASHFGVNGIGEGIIWIGYYKSSHYRFKVKGDKHSKSKVKKLPKVDDEKISKINEIVNQITPAFRLEQGIQEVFDIINGGEIDRKRLGDYIRWVMNDIIKEEMDIISEAKLEMKDINSKISGVVKNYFFEQEKL